MRETFAELLSLVAAHPLQAYAAVFLAALLEAVPVLGSVVPGSTVILGLGALAASDQLDLRIMVGAAAVGAFLGDGAAFLAGYRAKRQILQAWPLARYPALIARAEGFFARHGLPAVFFARFVAPVRALVPMTAGALGTAPRRYFPVSLAAVLLWAPLHVMPGAIAGDALRKLDAVGPQHPWLVVSLTVMAALLLWSAWQHLRRPIEAAAAPAANPTTRQPRGTGPV